MIPKIIHYCWLSGDPFPSDIKKCIESWKLHMPDWDFRLWDLKAVEGIESIWLKETIQTRKWAFAADFIRLFAVFHYGGIYLDSDVIVFKSLEPFLINECFIGRENSMHLVGFENTKRYLGSHCFGAEKGNIFIKTCLDYYENRRFILSNNRVLTETLRYDMKILPEIQSIIASSRFGLNDKYIFNKLQSLKFLTVYPSEYFDSIKETPLSFCRHLALGSWREKVDKAYVYTLKDKIEWRIRFIVESLLRHFNFVLIKLK